MLLRSSTMIAAILLTLIMHPALHAQDRAVDDISGAMIFIEELSAETIGIWSNEEMTAQERSDAFGALFLQSVDIDLLARAMLGRHFRAATPAQRQTYMEVMTAYILDAFYNRMRQFGFQKTNVVGTSPAPGKRGHVFVKTMVDRDEGQPIIADWRVKKKDGKFYIVNLEIEGINLVITNREYFAERIRALGGIDGLIEELRADIAEG